MATAVESAQAAAVPAVAAAEKSPVDKVRSVKRNMHIFSQRVLGSLNYRSKRTRKYPELYCSSAILIYLAMRR